MEGRISAASPTEIRQRNRKNPRWGFDRITTAQGAWVIFFGGWISALARLGFVTLFNRKTKAPEAYVFLPNYTQGVVCADWTRGESPIGKRTTKPGPPSPARLWITTDPHPLDDNIPLTVQVPVPNLGFVKVNFYAVPFRGLKVVIPRIANYQREEVTRVLARSIKGVPVPMNGSFSNGVWHRHAKIREIHNLPDGPLHLNETATFPVLIGRISEYVHRL